MKQISTNKAQSAKGLLSQAIVFNDLIFTSGFIHMDANGKMINGSVEEMFNQVIQNIKEVLIAGGSNLSNVLKVTIYVTDMAILPELNTHYVKHFADPMPAREAVCVKELPLGAKIEISVVARKG